LGFLFLSQKFYITTMKRKFSTTKISNKISNILEINISSKILFSNNNLNLGDNSMQTLTQRDEITVKTVILDGILKGREYDLSNHNQGDACDFLEFARIRKEPLRLPKYLEDIVAQYANPAVFYAAEVLERRWPEVEPMMLQDPEDAVQYATFVINGAWYEAEDIISTDASASIEYAYLIGKRFKKGEKTIINSKYLPQYIDLIRRDYKEFCEEYTEYNV
jgi:hypothetical protein